MTVPGTFRKAVEAKDLSAITSALDPGIEFHSPVMVKPYRGRDSVVALLGVLLEVFEDFRYTDELVGAGRPDAPSQALIFDARVMGKSVQGLDLLRFGDNGLVTGLTVMVRPLPAAMTLARAVGRRMAGPAAGRGVLSPAHRVAADLDGFLGDPMDEEAGPFSYKEIVEAEERDELPRGAVDAVRAWEFPEYLVPAGLGGRLTTLEDLFFVTRGISRRSVTVAVMYGSGLLAVNPVWLWGNGWQRKTVADGVLNGDLACFGVSEADHGSDVMASESEAEIQGDELVLTGTKWPVGNATRGRFVTTYARTGPRDFSLILVDKNELEPDMWAALPPVRTVGLRGHDLSGVAFVGARVPADRVIGRRGSGLVQTLKTLQITRTAIAALSVGTIDAVVRIGMKYARERTLYGADIYKIPVIRDHLVKAHLDLLIAECVAIPVTRALTVAPGRLSLWSSIVKYFVPVVGEEVVASIGTVLAARGYLREGVAHGVFQKLQRDHAIASVFEGTTHVNLANVAGQLPYLIEPPEETGGEEELLADLFCWTRTPPTWEPDGRRLQLTNEGRDEVGQRFEEISEELLAAANAHAAPGVAAELKDLLSSIGGLRAKVDEGIRANEGGTGSVAALARAKRYCELHAMMSCVLTWLHNRHAFGGAFADGRWLVLCLQRLLQRAHPDTVLSEEFLPSLEDAMFRCSDERRWFSQGRRRDAARRGGVPGQGPCGPRVRAARAERRPDRAGHRAADDERQDAAPPHPARVPRPGARCAIRFSLRSNLPSDAIATVWAVRGCCGSGQGFL